VFAALSNWRASPCVRKFMIRHARRASPRCPEAPPRNPFPSIPEFVRAVVYGLFIHNLPPSPRHRPILETRMERHLPPGPISLGGCKIIRVHRPFICAPCSTPYFQTLKIPIHHPGKSHTEHTPRNPPPTRRLGPAPQLRHTFRYARSSTTASPDRSKVHTPTHTPARSFQTPGPPVASRVFSTR